MLGIQAIVFFAFFSSCFATKFAMFPMPVGRSHFLFVSKLGQELAERGHEVKIYTGASSQNFAESSPFVRFFNDTKCSEWVKKASSKPVTETNPKKILALLYTVLSCFCDEMLGDSEVMNEVSSADLVVGEFMYLCSALVADQLSLPHVLISAPSLNHPIALAVGLPLSPTYASHSSIPLSSFMDRAKYIFFWVVAYLSYRQDLCASFGDVKATHNITPEKSIQETLGRVDMIISQVPFGLGLENPRPLPPNTRVVGPFLPGPPKPLSDELEQFMQRSGDDGVILVSFGSIVGDLFGINESVWQMMAEAFAKVPQKVIWKLKLQGTSRISLSENVKLLSWLPQNDILAHHKTRLFIAHAGMNGILESTYHGVPMICSPFFGDQFLNAQMAQQGGFAEAIDLKTLSSQDFVELIHKVINQASYRESAERISKSVKLLPRPPVKEAADWVEYAQAQGSLEFLKPLGSDLPFYELYCLDILLLAFSLLVLAIFLINSFFKVVRKSVSRFNGKHKTQ
ncbi:UDP-glucuronosyltransferase 2A3-like [Montipora foliosa]|uniref:UDP-glucuronosyltransferase 2A3-like n=1 Tax=Montipora foliosa TaxID=591990 RepID=UPI0035F15A6F